MRVPNLPQSLPPPPWHWLAYCRAGFERDLACELSASLNLSQQPRHAIETTGFIVIPGATLKLLAATPVGRLTFARQLLLTSEAPVSLTSNDRVNPLMAALQSLLEALGIAGVTDCWVEHPDTNDGKAQSRAARAIEPRLVEALDAAGLIVGHARHRAHVLLTPDKTAWVAIADVSMAAHEPCGITRVRMPNEAPSRSTLKLAEAIQVFLGDAADRALQPDMRAVDLGAAPGGWTWQLISRGVRVAAVDNGALKGDLVDNAMVKHMRMDGFKYQPTVPVDWMVCDMVESPSRIATLVAKWLTARWARYVIFNLKLPMKKRQEEVARCRDIIESACEKAGLPLILQLKQLYHDREEVTGYATIPSRRDGGQHGGRFAHNTSAAQAAKQRERMPEIGNDNASSGRSKSKTTAHDIASPWAKKPPPKTKSPKTNKAKTKSPVAAKPRSGATGSSQKQKRRQ
jgi:23S rRNA (cytidine2498-2'-O)-methyltransferase